MNNVVPILILVLSLTLGCEAANGNLHTESTGVARPSTPVPAQVWMVAITPLTIPTTTPDNKPFNITWQADRPVQGVRQNEGKPALWKRWTAVQMSWGTGRGSLADAILVGVIKCVEQHTSKNWLLPDTCVKYVPDMEWRTTKVEP